MPDEVARITIDDLARLNRAELRRVGVIARWVATGLFAVAAVGAFAWGWSTVHQQIRDSPGLFGPGTDNLSFVDRIDLLASNVVELVLVGVLVAAGIVVRLLGDVLVDRSGGTLCGYEVGDVVDPVADGFDDDTDDGDAFHPLTPLPPG